jgi:hypothetical protein
MSNQKYQKRNAVTMVHVLAKYAIYSLIAPN